MFGWTGCLSRICGDRMLRVFIWRMPFALFSSRVRCHQFSTQPPVPFSNLYPVFLKHLSKCGQSKASVKGQILKTFNTIAHPVPLRTAMFNTTSRPHRSLQRRLGPPGRLPGAPSDWPLFQGDSGLRGPDPVDRFPVRLRPAAGRGRLAPDELRGFPGTQPTREIPQIEHHFLSFCCSPRVVDVFEVSCVEWIVACAIVSVRLMLRLLPNCCCGCACFSVLSTIIFLTLGR